MSTDFSSQPSPAPEVGVDQPHLHALVRWRILRRCLFVAACLATLIGLFYAIEDWRGRRGWERCRRELENKGAVLDWNAYIPAPVPDEQNVFKAPKMTEWFAHFAKESWAETVSRDQSKARNGAQPFRVEPPDDPNIGTLHVADIEVVLSSEPVPPGKADAVLPFGDPAARTQAQKLLEERIGPCAEGATSCRFIARPFNQIQADHVQMSWRRASADQQSPGQPLERGGSQPDSQAHALQTATRPGERQIDAARLVRLVLQAPTMPTAKEIGDFLSPGRSPFQVVEAGNGTFRILLKGPVYTAADYLARTQPAESDLDRLREAVQRPSARMDGDYQRPYERPIPNFVRMRTVAQLLAQRAQCYLLLGQPEAAWHELELVRGLCHMLEAKPASDAPTLVEAMIDVAITGLYASIIEDGMRLEVWRQPELAAIQRQLEEINFIPLLHKAFEAERAATCRTFETSSRAELKKLFGLTGQPQGLLERLENPTYALVAFAPRGWIYQNMCVGAPLEQTLLEALDAPHNQVASAKFDTIADHLAAIAGHKPPYTFLAAVAMPNFVKATQTMARNQTLANEAFIACGLERYRLAHGQYPETLDSLVPQFAAQLPHDIIGGQSLRYHRSPDGRFTLYSVGWNGTDDGGVPGKAADDGDWVWQ